jgi:hypothetical protein
VVALIQSKSIAQVAPGIAKSGRAVTMVDGGCQ